jgi:hypothetical protein
MQQSLSEKDHLLRMAQSQCRSLEDAIEDRDKEVDQLKRKLELLLRKTGGLGGANGLDDEAAVEKAPPSEMDGTAPNGESDPKRPKLGRLFRRK